jgi:hypothetical protein
VGLNWHVDKFAILHQLHHAEEVHTSSACHTCKTFIYRFLLPVSLKVGVVQVLTANAGEDSARLYPATQQKEEIIIISV